MAITHCCVPYSTFLFRESFCCVSVPLPSPFLPWGYFAWHLKVDYVVSGSQESLQNPEKWEVGGQCGHRGGVAGLEPPALRSFGELTYRAGFVCSRGLGPSYMVVGLSLGKSPPHSLQSWEEMAVLSDVEAGLGKPTLISRDVSVKG